MADPTYDSLDKMFGGGPLALHFQMNQMDQAKQVAAEDFKMKEQNRIFREKEVRAKELANMFEEKNMGPKLEEQPIKNRNDTATADFNESKARVAKATEQYTINDAARAELTKLNDHQLKLVEQEAQKMMMTGTPKQQAQGAQVMQMTTEFHKLRYADQLAGARDATKEAGHNARQASQNETQIKVANIGAASREAVASMRKVQDNYDIALAKLAPDKQILELKEILVTGRHPATKEPLSAIERQGYQARYEKAIQVVDAKPNPAKEDAIFVVDPVTGKGKLGSPSQRQSVGDKKPLSDEELLKLYGAKK